MNPKKIRTINRKGILINRLALLALLLVPFSVSAAELPCSIRPAKGTTDPALPGLAKVSQAAARKAALARIKAPSTNVVDGELEIEQGCLVYSFDIRISDKPGIEEIMVDAGTGKILSHKHESPRQEAVEKAKDKASSRKPQ
jgi:hypothetical protein